MSLLSVFTIFTNKSREVTIVVINASCEFFMAIFIYDSKTSVWTSLPG